MPHVCGDEPPIPAEGPRFSSMPHVCGDEPLEEFYKAGFLRMPHVCGDEPAVNQGEQGEDQYAPRMWG